MEENESFFKEFVIPKIDVKSIKSKFTLCDVPIPNWIDDEIKSGKGMIKTIISLKDFSSTYQNIYRQVSIHFSKHVHIFLFHCIKIISEVPFRLGIIAELTEMLLMGENPLIVILIFFGLYSYRNPNIGIIVMHK